MRKILIIDAEVSFLRVMVDFLQLVGYLPLALRDSRLALEVAHQKKPDLIICDASALPIAGSVILQSLRAHPQTAAIPVLLLSTRPTDEAWATEKGATAYLSKPFEAHKLLNVIAECLKK